MMAAQIGLRFSYLFNLWTIERFRDERSLRWTNENDCFPVAENFYLASLNRSKFCAFASRASASAIQWNRLSEMLQRSLLEPSVRIPPLPPFLVFHGETALVRLVRGNASFTPAGAPRIASPAARWMSIRGACSRSCAQPLRETSRLEGSGRALSSARFPAFRANFVRTTARISHQAQVVARGFRARRYGHDQARESGLRA